MKWSFALRIPDHIAIFYGECLAILLAVLKLDYAQSSVMVLTNFLSMCMALSLETVSPMLKTFYSCVPSYVRAIRFVWLPDYCGLAFHEAAYTLAKQLIC